MDILQECELSYLHSYKNTQTSKSYNFSVLQYQQRERLNVIQSINVTSDQLQKKLKTNLTKSNVKI